MKPCVNNKIILDLCGGTGSWSKPYTKAGYDVRLITLPDNDVRTYIPPNNIYGILAAPPCTMFSLARTRAKRPRDFREGMEIVQACLRIIWECRYAPLYRKDVSLKFWALENPTGFLRQFLGLPAYNFKPSEFGDPINKKTDLWGYFNKPKKLKMSVDVPVGLHRSSANYPRCPIKRAITPQGFAKAFFKTNK